MTLHALRVQVGDEDFFRILRRWAVTRAGDNVTTDEFIALAEAISGQQLDALFDVWLFTDEKPILDGALRARVSAREGHGSEGPAFYGDLLARMKGAAT